MVVVGFVEAGVVVGVVCDVDGVGDAVCAPVFDLHSWVVGVFVDVVFEFVSVVDFEFESCCELWHKLYFCLVCGCLVVSVCFVGVSFVGVGLVCGCMKEKLLNLVFFVVDYNSSEFCPHDGCNELLFESGELRSVFVRVGTFESWMKLKSFVKSESRSELESEINLERLANKFTKEVNVEWDSSGEFFVCPKCGERLWLRHDEKLFTDGVFQDSSL